MKSFFFILIFVCFISFLPFAVRTGIAAPPIEITGAMPPPNWALLERELLKANAEAIEAYASVHFDTKGYLLHTPRWGAQDGPDDAFEAFNYWTLLYSLGASESLLELHKKCLEGHYQQYKPIKTVTTDIAKDGCYYREFMPKFDWLHHGEGMQPLLHQGLCDPTDFKYQNRMRRFAGMYMNEDSDAQNYDPQHKIIKSILNGSKGPLLRDATVYDWEGDPMTGRFHLLHIGGRKKMLQFEDYYDEMLKIYEPFLQTVGDNPLNLVSTILPLHAYMLAHEQKYKDWLLEYINAWKERTVENGGIIPANVGLDGTIGGAANGKWYKGTLSWSHDKMNLSDWGMWAAFSNALLLTGDQSYIDVLRRQVDILYENKKIIKGETALSFNYGDNGWFGWDAGKTRRFMERLIEIYMWSMDRKDLERIPIQGWIAFLEGQNPEYPEKAFGKDFSFIRQKMREMRLDSTTADTRLADWAMDINPATIHNLYSLMQGGFFTGYYTGRMLIEHCRARYFDPAKQRAGMPEDVAALVTKMDNETTTLILVNINQIEFRDVIIQTGGYGEHQCMSAQVEGRMYPVNNRYFAVRLAPGAGDEIVMHIKRYANQPTLAFPWHGDIVPAVENN